MRVGLSALWASVLALSLAACCCPRAVADPTIGDKPAIQCAYDQLNSAFIDNAMSRMNAIWTDDYTQTDPAGHVLNRQGAMKKYQGMRNQIRTMQAHYEITSITPQSNGDIVEMTEHSWGMGAKKFLFVKVGGTFTNDLKVRDFWLSTPQGMRLKYRLLIEDQSQMKAG
jgi:hypothetical protein